MRVAPQETSRFRSPARLHSSLGTPRPPIRTQRAPVVPSKQARRSLLRSRSADVRRASGSEQDEGESRRTLDERVLRALAPHPAAYLPHLHARTRRGQRASTASMPLPSGERRADAPRPDPTRAPGTRWRALTGRLAARPAPAAGPVVLMRAWSLRDEMEPRDQRRDASGAFCVARAVFLR